MTAEKANKVYNIEEGQKDAYQAAGYDIRDDEGNVIAYGAGKTVSYADYVELRKENEELKSRVEELEGLKGSAEEQSGKTTAKKKAVE